MFSTLILFGLTHIMKHIKGKTIERWWRKAIGTKDEMRLQSSMSASCDHITTRPTLLWHHESNFMMPFLFIGMGVMRLDGYKKTSVVAAEWGISDRRLNILCKEGRIQGAEKIGNMWLIPSDAEKPKDERIKSGKYMKKNKIL